MNRLNQATVEQEAISGELVWLNIVWSLAVLNKALPQHLESVLTPEFYNKLLCKYL